MSWIGRGARFTLGAALIVGTIALAFAAGRVLILVFIAVTLAAGLGSFIAWARGRLGERERPAAAAMRKRRGSKTSFGQTANLG